MDYTTLSLADVRTGLRDVARDAHVTFGSLDARQLGWKPDPTRWGVGQCFQHLLTSNRDMLQAARNALSGPPHTLWQRLPLLPGVFGRLLIRTQSPGGTRKYTAPRKAQPSSADVPADIVQQFVDQQVAAAEWLDTLDDARAAKTIMISPFIGFVTYSVLDGSRLLVAHDRRHFEQAQRVTELPEFPR
jgi:hypothetical protein